MALKDTWKDKVDNVDEVQAKDINDIAQAVIELEDSEVEIDVDTEMSDTSENAVQNKIIKSYVDGKIGDIETALDSIISLQNSLIGGESE